MINPKTKQRELAYTVLIDAIEPIEGSDNCEAAIVGGWKVMVRKNTFTAGDLAVYFEIDSKLPETYWSAFLANKHYKVKSQKYTFGGKGNFLSQGLLMSLGDFEDYTGAYPACIMQILVNINLGMFYRELVNTPLTEELGVTYSVAEDNKRKSSGDKYKKMAQRHWKLFKHSRIIQWLYGRIWGKKLLFLFLGRKKDKKEAFWPSWVVKTDEERVQNLPQMFPPDGTKWIATEKIDGSSTTFTMKRGKRGKYEYYVCSRNVCFDKPEKEAKLFYETNIYTEMAEKYNIYDVLKNILDLHKEFDFVTIQGETYGGGVQSKTYGIKGHDFMAFNLIVGDKDGVTKRYNSIEMTEILKNTYNIPCVPIIATDMELLPTIDDMLNFATGDSVVEPGTLREGLVFRTYDGVRSFKAVSNEYLLSKSE